MKIPKNEHGVPNLGIFDMSNRVNLIRVWSKVFGRHGVYQRHNSQIFMTPSGASSYLRKLNIESRGDEGIYESGEYFVKVEIGNGKGWVAYDIDPNGLGLIESLSAAREMHLGFYDEGESDKDKENAA